LEAESPDHNTIVWTTDHVSGQTPEKRVKTNHFIGCGGSGHTETDPTGMLFLDISQMFDPKK
jgi:hypothetical protein